MKRSIGWWLAPLMVVNAFAAAPMLEKLEPRGAQRGKAVKLTLVGTGLTSDAEILTSLPGGITALTPPKSEGRAGLELPFLLEIPSDAAIDTYPVRIRTRDGLSNVLLFTLGAFPETIEAESETEIDEPLNDSAETAQEVTTPVIVNGNLGPGDRDYYRFKARAGERLIFEVEARRAGSAIDPVLRVVDGDGNVLVRNADAPGLGVDPRAEVVFDQAGSYFVEVHEAKFGALRENFYRLKIGDFSYADGIFPLGWQRGGKVKTELFGGNLAKTAELRPDFSGVDEKARSIRIRVPGKPGALPLNFAVGPDAETFEPRKAKNKTLKPGVVVNGRVAKTGEVDRYSLAVAPGETWRFEMDAASLGTSSLYALLTLYNEAGTKLASAGDIPPKDNVYAVVASMGPGEDPFLVLTIPDGTRKLDVRVEDLLGRGGREFAYRLLAKREPGDFQLTVTTPYLNIPERGTAIFSVLANRRGYQGAIKIEIPNLPDDIEMSGGNIAPTPVGAEGGLRFRRAVVTLTPKPGAPARMLDLDVWGVGKTEDRTFRRHALSPAVVSVAADAGGVPLTPDSIEAPLMNTALVATVAPEEPAVLEVLTPRLVRLIMGQNHELSWSFHARQPGIRPPEEIDARLGIATFINRGKRKKYAKEGKMTVVTSESAGFGTEFADLPLRFDMLLSGKIKVDGAARIVYAPAVIFEMVLGYGVNLPTEISLAPGETTTLVGSVTREPGFDSPIAVKLDSLPVGVSCKEAEVTTAAKFELSCTAGDEVEPGRYDIQITASSTLPGSEEKHVPLKMKPIEAKLSVEDPKTTVAQAAQ